MLRSSHVAAGISLMKKNPERNQALGDLGLMGTKKDISTIFGFPGLIFSK